MGGDISVKIKRLPIFILWAAALLMGASPASLYAQDPCTLPAGLNPISQCVDGAGNALIGPGGGPDCTRVVFDQSLTGAKALKKITVEAGGEVYIGDGTLNAEVETIQVAGLFQVGSDSCPIGTRDPGHQVTLTFLGERSCPSPQPCSEFQKGIEVLSGGRLRMFGIKGVPPSDLHPVKDIGVSWTHLSVPAGPEKKYGPGSGALAPVPPGGATTIQLAQDVTQGPGAWRPGDWIAIATTGFSAVETEIVQISDLRPNPLGGSVVELSQELRHYHFGGPDPGLPSLDNFNACSGFNYGVDERAEVGLLSRNVKLTARIEPGANHLHWGGELRFHQGFQEAALQGVELEKFGKDQLGGYPIHFHRAGSVAAQKPRINANSIHHSYNKCVTIHSTQDITVENNVCVRVVGHLFYQEFGDESGVRYLNNLGLGAMSHYFDVVAENEQERETKIKNFWWDGDHLGQKDSPQFNGYDGFNVPNTDAQDNPVRGVCANPRPGNEGLIQGQNPFTPPHPGACSGNEIYIEPPTGFWIIDPGTDLIGNSIGGCQDVGRGYWYVPPKNRPDAGVPAALRDLSLKPLGTFKNNRVHSCYSGLYGEEEFGVFSEQLFPREGGVNTGKNILAVFDGLTSTRNRDRGVWLRPVWLVVKNGRFATNRNSVTLVSSGGLDGNAPGVWALLEDSVLVGLSQNNVERWGPCPVNASNIYECVHASQPGKSGFDSAKGMPSPSFNFSGFMIYDGPVRIFRDRFVNFNRDITPRLTVEDKTFLENYTNYPNGNFPNVYEGDAALGWFQNNQSAYPTGTETRELSWDNVDLRHQIYTEKVNWGDFQDGDRNTAVLDLDGSLTGFHVVDPSGNPVPGAHPISLNNLEFNHASNSVDECLAEGEQDAIAEGRPTSLISPGHYATLEFQALFPPPLPVDPVKQLMTFAKDQEEFGEHPEMSLTSRNGLGVWEPKVASGYGYTVQASPCTRKPECSDQSGIPPRVLVGLTDAVKPEIGEDDPFYVRIGICYTHQNGSYPANDFTITRGYRSWGGNGTNTQDPDLQKYFNVLQNRYQNETCHNLDFQNPPNRDPDTGCPASGVTPFLPDGPCPVQTNDQQGRPACVFPTGTLSKADSVDELILTDGFPDLTKYFYDESRGMLFFYVAQELPNAFGPSPLGTCRGGEGDDPACPLLEEGESYYACPPAGCSDYLVELNDPSYIPGPSDCEPYPTYAQDPPPDEMSLAYLGGNEIVQQVEAPGMGGNFPHFEPASPPECPATVVAGVDTLGSGDSGIKFARGAIPAPPICPEVAPLGGGGCALSGQAEENGSLWPLAFLLLVGSFRLRRRALGK